MAQEIDLLRSEKMPAVAPPLQRLVSLDTFRGITIAAMILVNNPGTWSAVYAPLLHAPWHGWTPTDLVFPFFLFIVGVAIVLAYTKRLERGVARTDLVRKAIRRAMILFGLGLFMAAYPFFKIEPAFGLADHIGRLRIPGVLQRIALCYLAVSLFFLYFKPRVLLATAVGILLGYWATLMWIPVPGYGAGMIDAGTSSLAGYLDRLILGEHLWVGANQEWDPEGLLSTLPAIVTTLIGVWAGRVLIADQSPTHKTAHLLVAGVLMVSLGYLWNWFFPINKSLWTSSYVVFTGGQALCALGICYWFSDVKGYRQWTRPFVVYGINAITVFVMSGLLAKTLIRISFTQADGSTQSLQQLLFNTVFAPLGPPRMASLLYAITWILGWYGVLWLMHRRGMIIKV